MTAPTEPLLRYLRHAAQADDLEVRQTASFVAEIFRGSLRRD
jgi:hypothetical protein